MRRIAMAAGAGAMLIILAISAVELPEFGSDGGSVASYYLGNGLHETGSANIVNSIVWDFRGFDTMGEETVLFSAAIGVFLVLRSRKYGPDN